ncbi:hypothetical protein F4775DRAFT_608406 [Biscogniauxia sp. FL1348]|nr:hypothetical protein F4775DRAFT_608406 [Biscogniauxia sp. FL1348]
MANYDYPQNGYPEYRPQGTSQGSGHRQAYFAQMEFSSSPAPSAPRIYNPYGGTSSNNSVGCGSPKYPPPQPPPPPLVPGFQEQPGGNMVPYGILPPLPNLPRSTITRQVGGNIYSPLMSYDILAPCYLEANALAGFYNEQGRRAPAIEKYERVVGGFPSVSITHGGRGSGGGAAPSTGSAQPQPPQRSTSQHGNTYDPGYGYEYDATGMPKGDLEHMEKHDFYAADDRGLTNVLAEYHGPEENEGAKGPYNNVQVYGNDMGFAYDNYYVENWNLEDYGGYYPYQDQNH